MAKIHAVLNGKGGVGKTFVATHIAQAIRSIKGKVRAIDTDPVNATLFRFKALDVQRIEIMKDDEIDTRLFDKLVEFCVSGDTDVVIDNGASSFVPLSHYVISNQVPALLRELGHELILHVVIAGGDMCLDTINGFDQLASQFSTDVQFVVWLNPFVGDVVVNGKAFEQMNVYRNHKDRISAIVELPRVKAETYGKDLSEMMADRLTYDEAVDDSNRHIMVRHRLRSMRDQIMRQLNALPVLQ